VTHPMPGPVGADRTPDPPHPEQVRDLPSPPAGARPPTRRESRWLLRRCGRLGHVLAHLDDPLARRTSAPGPDGLLLRCLRCGTFVDPHDAAVAADHVHGSAARPAELAQLPLVVRGSHGRKLAVLRLLALERGGRGVLLIAAAAGLAQLAGSHVAVAEWLGRVAQAAQPLGDQIGWDVARSHLLQQTQDLLGHSSAIFTLVAWLVGGYGMLQIVEAIGLWGGWRWAEYLAAVATSAFVPLEVYELYDHATVIKAAAFAVNIIAVCYLVIKGRLFGVRGGHRAYLAEVRDATLLADELVRIGRPSTLLRGHRLV
jgi:uncharacterized membrane protein (DUF2068 family)